MGLSCDMWSLGETGEMYVQELQATPNVRIYRCDLCEMTWVAFV